MNNFRFTPPTDDVMRTLEALSILYSQKGVETAPDESIFLDEDFRAPLNKLFKYLETVDLDT